MRRCFRGASPSSHGRAAGALDVQASELRRIERDLHDGAQARLVALSMKLGRAEDRYRDDTDISAVLREAREDTTSAIRELRELARGITPPVLADRGLEAAASSLAQRSGSEVSVTGSLRRRPGPAVETAAYFVVAESLTNAAKHAPGALVEVRLAEHGGDLFVEITDFGPGGRGLVRRRAHRSAPTRRGARRHAHTHQPRRRRHAGRGDAPVRVVIVEDHALLREGMVALLQEHDIEVVAQADDGPGLLRIVEGHKPDLAVCDVRLPPTFTDEGIRAALEARRRHPELAILVLSQYVEPAYSAELLSEGHGGIGYLLKERVSEVRTFVDAVRRVAAGGTVLDREVVSTLVSDRRGASSAAVDAIESLTARERQTLELVAQGRSNAAIARELVVTLGAVEKHISSIFVKLDLPAADDDHRRVLAVLAFLRATDEDSSTSDRP